MVVNPETSEVGFSYQMRMLDIFRHLCLTNQNDVRANLLTVFKEIDWDSFQEYKIDEWGITVEQLLEILSQIDFYLPNHSQPYQSMIVFTTWLSLPEASENLVFTINSIQLAEAIEKAREFKDGELERTRTSDLLDVNEAL
jgi:hypothetical protein